MKHQNGLFRRFPVPSGASRPGSPNAGPAPLQRSSVSGTVQKTGKEDWDPGYRPERSRAAVAMRQSGPEPGTSIRAGTAKRTGTELKQVRPGRGKRQVQRRKTAFPRPRLHLFSPFSLSGREGERENKAAPYREPGNAQPRTGVAPHVKAPALFAWIFTGRFWPPGFFLPGRPQGSRSDRLVYNSRDHSHPSHFSLY